ncbi:MAG TPA: guanylate kinase [Acidimicrobiales bacterium]|nr:guanylate kinase [Acidimicrobiales bacterium]
MSVSPQIVVLIGPGGVGKGTIARRLVAADPTIWLSRSWTTRSRRPTEADTDYTFVDRATFERAIHDNAFLEWAEFHDNLYGTPRPAHTDDVEVLLEIEVQGAEQVRQEHPDAVVFLILAPSTSDLEERLRSRGDTEDHVRRRLASTPGEVERGRALADFEVVNDDPQRATAEILSILEGLRRRRRAAPEKD